MSMTRHRGAGLNNVTMTRTTGLLESLDPRCGTHYIIIRDNYKCDDDDDEDDDDDGDVVNMIMMKTTIIIIIILLLVLSSSLSPG